MTEVTPSLKHELAPTATSSGFWAVIPAGGAGTRLWPLSRGARPKFLLPLLGTRSMLQQTADRVAPLATPDRIMVVCGPAHAAAVARQLPQIPETHLLVEPMPKGSGPAIALATAIIARHEPDAVMGSFAADHDVRDEAAFVRAVQAATAAAKAGWLVTIGLTPTRPEIGYGYIERTNDALIESDGMRAYRSARFVEKPDLARAQAFLESGRFLWNASMFIWRPQVFLDELARLQPELSAGVARIAAAWGTTDYERVLAQVWPTLPETTVDHGVMEHAERVAVVPATMGWSDVGDWHGLGELMAHDADGNSARADLIATGTRNSVVWSETGRVVALVGLDGVVVVDTPDALLIADRAKAQEVRQSVAFLKRAGRAELT